MRLPLCLAIVLLSACAADAEPPDVVGVWAMAVPGDCARVLRFRADDTFRRGMFCDGPEVLAAIDDGEYQVEGGRLTWWALESTCAGASTAPASARYSVQGDSLTITGSDGALIFESLPEDDGEPGAGATVRFGCFTESGAFEPMPLRTL